MDIPKEKVKLVVDEYWKKVYDKLLTLEATTVYIREVGLITISRYKLRRFILRWINKIRNVKKTPKYDEVERKRILDNMTAKLSKALAQRNIIAKYNSE